MGLDRNNAILNMMYRGTTTIADFNWDAMTTVPILYLMTPDDIDYIKNLILSPRYSGNNKYKMEKIDEIMHFRGFSRFAGGTNRLVYTHPMAPNAVFKVAIDSVGIHDNPAEFKNQHFLKPYCCKVFECSPCGTIASFEKVERITTFEEFYTIADDYYYIIVNVILGKYVMDDIGIDYFMNIGIRVGCYPVLLDFPYLFELDGGKLECCNVLDDGRVCSGEIDYDAGFNKLVCKKCGRVYRARDLAKPPKEGGILLRQKGGRRMLLEITRGGKVIKTYDTTIERDYLSRNDRDVTNNRVPEVVLKRVKVETKKVKTPAPKAEPKQSVQPAKKPVQVETPAPAPVKRVIKEIDVSRSNRVVEEEPATPATNNDHIVELVLDRPAKSVSEPVEEPKQDRDTVNEIVMHKTGNDFPESPILQRVTRPVVGIDIGIMKAEPTTEHIAEVNLNNDKEEVEQVQEEAPIESDLYSEPESAEKNDISDTAWNKLEEDESTAPVIGFGKSIGDEEAEIVEDKDKSSIIPSFMISAELNPTGKMMPAIYFGDEPGGYDPEEEIEEKEEKDMETEDPNTDTPPSQITFIDVIDVVDEDIDYDPTVIMNYLNERDIEPKVGSLFIVRHIYSDKDIENINVPYMYGSPEEGDEPTWFRTDRDSFADFDKEIVESIEKHEEASETYVNSEEEEHSEIDDTEEQYPEVEPDIVEDIEDSVEVDKDIVESDEEEIDEEVESTSENEIDLISKERIVLTSKIPTAESANDDTIYCVPRHKNVNTSDLTDGIKDVYDINIDKYRIYVKHDGKVIAVRCVGGYWYEFDEEAARPIDVLVGNSIVFISGYDLPAYEDADMGTYYLLSTDKENVYDAFIKRIDRDEYSFYLRVTTEEDEEDADEEEKEEFDDKIPNLNDMVAKLKASSKKKSIEDVMN